MTPKKQMESSPDKVKRVTMKTVAKLAGVAPITVSRFLSDATKVSVALRDKIQRAIDELDYIPNRMAGGLSSASAPVVPIIVPDLRNAVFADIILGVQETLLMNNLQVFIGNTNYSLQKEEQLISAFMEWSPKALIITGMTHSEKSQKLLTTVGIPVVELMDLSRRPIDMCVGFSDFEAAEQLTVWLIKRGYHRIAFLGAMLDQDTRAHMRLKGYRSALKKANLGPGKQITLSQPTALTINAPSFKWLQDPDNRPEAVFCASDILAAGLIFECQRLGISIPDDLAVVGFHNLPISEAINPGLTTVKTPRYEIGRKAAELILDRIADRNIKDPTFDLGYDIIVRQSA